VAALPAARGLYFLTLGCSWHDGACPSRRGREGHLRTVRRREREARVVEATEEKKEDGDGSRGMVEGKEEAARRTRAADETRKKEGRCLASGAVEQLGAEEGL
jgi:hypothetical protein